MGEWLLELFIRGSHRSAMVDPHLSPEVLLLISKASPPLPCAGATTRECCVCHFGHCLFLLLPRNVLGG